MKSFNKSKLARTATRAGIIGAGMLATASVLFARLPFAFDGRLHVVEPEKKTLDEQLLESLVAVNKRLGEVDALKKNDEAHTKALEELNKILAEIKSGSDALRKQMVGIGAQRARRGGEVSEECAKHLGAIGLVAALRTPGDMLDRKSVV